MRIGLMGAGYMSHVHAKSLKAAGHELVAVNDENADVAKAFAQIHSCKAVKGNKDLLAQDIDMVAIIVPNPYHHDAVLEALASDVPLILCEKPMTRSKQHARDLVEKVNASNKKFFVGYMKRLHPTMRQWFEYVKQVGRPYSGLVRTYHPMTESSWEWVRGRVKAMPTRVFDGMLVNGGSHMLDLLLWAWGPVKRVIGARMQMHPDFETIDYGGHALLEMQNGATVIVECGNLPLLGVGRHDNGWDELIECRGFDGLARIFTPLWNAPDADPAVADFWHEPTKSRQGYNAGNIDYFIREYELLGKAFAGEEVPLARVEDGAAVDNLIEDIFAAARR